LTQAQVARLAGYETSQFISNIERGAAVAPLGLLAKLVRLYKADPNVLIRIILKSQRAHLMQKLIQYRGRPARST
jgi:hypothetical protein